MTQFRRRIRQEGAFYLLTLLAVFAIFFEYSYNFTLSDGVDVRSVLAAAWFIISAILLFGTDLVGTDRRRAVWLLASLLLGACAAIHRTELPARGLGLNRIPCELVVFTLLLWPALRGREEEKWLRGRKFAGIFLLLMVLEGLRAFDHGVSQFNTTPYAFTYHYGFLSRGLMGTLLAGIDRILPGEQYNYTGIQVISAAATVILFGMLACFWRRSDRTAREEDRRNVRLLILFSGIITVPFFLCDANFGRLDLFLMILTLASLFGVLSGKCLFLVPVFCGIAMLIHQGFVFTHMSLVLVLLWYRAAMSEGTMKRKYRILLGVTFAVVSVLFLYFEFGSHHYDDAVYRQIVREAVRLSPTEDYSGSLVRHEILGRDVYDAEKMYHPYNRRSLLFMVICFAPYLPPLIRIFRGLMKRAENPGKKLACLVVACGSLTIVPEVLLKVDYGRYLHMVLFYYAVIFLCLYQAGDRHLSAILREESAGSASRQRMSLLLAIYPLFYAPMYDVIVCDSIDHMVRFFFHMPV